MLLNHTLLSLAVPFGVGVIWPQQGIVMTDLTLVGKLLCYVA